MLHWQKLLISCFIILICTVLLGAGPTVSQIEPISLIAEPVPFTPKDFYIADIIDERTDRKAVAYLLPVPTASGQPAKAEAVDLKGGGRVALRQFIGQSMPQNKRLRPVVIRIKELKVTETAGAKGMVDGRVAIAMEFDLLRDGEYVNLIQYKGGAKYGRSANQLSVVEPALRQSLVSSLKYLNTWMDREADVNEKLAKGLKVSFSDHISQDADTVFYDPSRPLVWSDFRGRSSKPGNFAAAVFPGFGYDSHFEVVKGIIHIRMIMKVFVVKDYSWVKDSARNAYGLNHEQRHFDIVKLVAERYKQKVQPENLTVADYNSILQYQYIESYREMNRLQEQYDAETRHGIDEAAQERWNKRINDELKAFKVK